MLHTRRTRIFIIILFLVSSVAFIAFHLFFPNIFLIQQKPAPLEKAYENYIIIDVDTNKVLMYVPLLVHVGDEVISEENKRYQVIRIEENRAYARFVENVNLDQYTPPPK